MQYLRDSSSDFDKSTAVKNVISPESSQVINLSMKVSIIVVRSVAPCQRTQNVDTRQMSSKEPTLFLEDFDHLLHEVECTASTMSIKFRLSAKYKRACAQTEGLIHGWIVSSHMTCSEDGAHAVYK